MRIVFMGTPDFASVQLSALIDNGYDVIGVITQPDKPVGRKGILTPPPVKEEALKHNIPVFQPATLKNGEGLKIMEALTPELSVVAAYGKILPPDVLSFPKYGCINIHGSLLPKYRGAAPIEWAIIDGEQETGVTTMYMAKGLDTGDMIEREVVQITVDDTGESLTDKLAECGAKLILSTLKKLEDGTAVRTVQDDSLSCYASMLTKNMGDIDFTQPAEKIERLVRGLQPWPCAFTKINGKGVKIYGANVVDKPEGVQPGSVINVTKKSFAIACGEGAIQITRLQPEGKKPMDTAAFLAGNKLIDGQHI